MTSSSLLASFMRILQIENNNLRSSVIISDNSKTHATVQNNNNNNNKEDLTWWKIPTSSCNADLTRRQQDEILPPFERPHLLTYPIKKPTRWEDGAGSRRIVRGSFLQLNPSLSERREQQRKSKAAACLSPVCPRRQSSVDSVDLDVLDSSKDLRIINISQGKWRAAQQTRTLSPVCPKRQASIDEEWDDLDVNVEEDQEASSHESLKAPACGRLGRILESRVFDLPSLDIQKLTFASKAAE